MCKRERELIKEQKAIEAQLHETDSFPQSLAERSRREQLFAEYEQITKQLKRYDISRLCLSHEIPFFLLLVFITLFVQLGTPISAIKKIIISIVFSGMLFIGISSGIKLYADEEDVRSTLSERWQGVGIVTLAVILARVMAYVFSQ